MVQLKEVGEFQEHSPDLIDIIKIYSLFQDEVFPEDLRSSESEIKSNFLIPNKNYYTCTWLLYTDANSIFGFTTLRFDTKSPDITSAFANIYILSEFRNLENVNSLIKIIKEKMININIKTVQIPVYNDILSELLLKSGAILISNRVRSRIDLVSLDHSFIENLCNNSLIQDNLLQYDFVYSIPDFLLESYCQLYNQLEKETPETEVEGLPLISNITSESVKILENRLELTHHKRMTLLVYKDQEVIALTELFFSTDNNSAFDQDMTGVKKSYRGKGLGLLIKAKMIQFILQNYPLAKTIETGNSTINFGMLKINKGLGFKNYLKESFLEITI